MSQLFHTYRHDQFHRMATVAYARLIKGHSTVEMQNLVDYMASIGLDHDASNNQLTFWSRTSRSPTRERIVVDMQGPQDPMLERNATSTMKATHYVAYFIDHDGAAAIQREMDNAPDKLADARQALKDRADGQDPALRNGPLSIDISQ